MEAVRPPPRLLEVEDCLCAFRELLCVLSTELSVWSPLSESSSPESSSSSSSSSSSDSDSESEPLEAAGAAAAEMLALFCTLEA